MRNTLKWFSLLLALSLSITCQPSHVITTQDHGHSLEARTYWAGETLWLEVKVPLISGKESWQAKFDGAIPDGLKSKATEREAIFSWIVPRDRITWFETNGYNIKLVSGDHIKDINIRISKQTPNVTIPPTRYYPDPDLMSHR